MIFEETDYSMRVKKEPNGCLKTFKLNLKEFDPTSEAGRTMGEWLME
jgi:hypothetical protein